MRPASDNRFQTEVLERIKEIKEAVDESLKLGRSNGEEIRGLRKELGIDPGAHGRIPQLEAQWARLDRQQELDHKELCALINQWQEKTERRFEEMAKKQHETTNKLIGRIEPLERVDFKAQGKSQLWGVFLNVLTSSASATAIGILAKILGWLH